MRILVRKNIRAVGSNDLLGPVLEVECIELINSYRTNHNGDGTRKKAHELIFVEVDEDLLVAMRLEASILAKGGEVSPRKFRK